MKSFGWIRWAAVLMLCVSIVAFIKGDKQTGYFDAVQFWLLFIYAELQEQRR